MTTQALILAISKRGDSVVLAVHGELDAAGALAWTRSFADACASSAQHITIDLAGVTFIDSTGLRMLLLAGDAAEGLGLYMDLANVPAKVTRLIELCGLVGHFNEIAEGTPATAEPLAQMSPCTVLNGELAMSSSGDD